MTDENSIADILGPWLDSDFDSGLVNRCKQAWSKPIKSLTNGELATLLRQRIAVSHILPVAEQRLKESVDDRTEIYDEELKNAVEYVSGKACPVQTHSPCHPHSPALGLAPYVTRWHCRTPQRREKHAL